MRIDSALPLHVARAYDIKPAGAAQPPRAAGAVSNLVAARVPQPVDFSAVPSQGPANILQLYNRAADRVEAAVAIQIGRQLDVTG